MAERIERVVAGAVVRLISKPSVDALSRCSEMLQRQLGLIQTGQIIRIFEVEVGRGIVLEIDELMRKSRFSHLSGAQDGNHGMVAQ